MVDLLFLQDQFLLYLNSGLFFLAGKMVYITPL